ncbi:MAG: type IV secretory system conjugative DNA transfer family protein, partial [Bacteroidota bacterium]
MAKTLKHNLLAALLLDVCVHLLVLKPMARQVHEYGLTNVDTWNYWIYDFLFTGHRYPVTMFEPAALHFGGNAMGIFVIPYLICLFFVCFRNPLYQIFILFPMQLLQRFLPVIANLILAVMMYIADYFKKAIILFIKKMDDARKAAFMPWLEQLKQLNRWNHGLTIGNKALTLPQTTEHTMVYGTSGSGKTKTIIINTLLNAVGNFLVTDPAQELWNTCSGYLQEKKNMMLMRFCPSMPEQSDTFNPIVHIERLRNGASILAESLIIMKYGASSGSDNSFFHSGGKRILKCVIQAVSSLVHTHPQVANLHNVYNILNQLQYEREKAQKFIMEHLDEHWQREFMGAMGGNPKQLNDKISTAQEALEFFSDPLVIQMTATNSIDFDVLRKKPAAVFFQVSEDETKYYAPVINLFMALFFKHTLQSDEEKSKQLIPLHLILEEAGALGRINGLEVAINQVRKYGVSITMVGQDPLSQFTAIYGKEEGMALINAPNNQVIFGGTPYETAIRIERTLGTVENDKGKSIPVLPVSALSNMGKGKILLMMNRKKPILIKAKTYKDYRVLRK